MRSASSQGSTLRAPTPSRQDASGRTVRRELSHLRLDVRRRRSTSATAPRSAPTRSTTRSRRRPRSRSTRRTAQAQTAYQSAESTYEKLVAVAPTRSERPARARAGRAAERRTRPGDRRLPAVPEARAGRPERADREAADCAAEGRADAGDVRLDSPPSGRHRTHSVGETGGPMNFDIKTEQLERRRVRHLAGGRGRPLHGAGVQAAAARGDRPGRPRTSSSTSATRPSSTRRRSACSSAA